MENEVTQNVNEMNVTLNLSIGEWNAIFGVINTGAFQSVMADVATNVNDQIRSQNIPISRSQQDALKMTVPINLKLGVINTIVSIVQGNTGFIAVMQPIIDKITGQAQDQVSQLQPVTNADMPMPLQFPTGQVGDPQ